MTETVSVAVPASSVPPTAVVVPVAVHSAIVAKLEADVAVAEADLAKTYKAHQVWFIVGAAVLATSIVFHILF